MQPSITIGEWQKPDMAEEIVVLIKEPITGMNNQAQGVMTPPQV